MSVASGKFFDGITSFAGGAPRANGTGNSKVFYYEFILFFYRKIFLHIAHRTSTILYQTKRRICYGC